MFKLGTDFDYCSPVFARNIRQLLDINLLTPPALFSGVINMKILRNAEHPAFKARSCLPLLYPCQSPFHCFLQQIVASVVAAGQRQTKAAQSRQERNYARLDVLIGSVAALHFYVHPHKTLPDSLYSFAGDKYI